MEELGAVRLALAWRFLKFGPQIGLGKVVAFAALYFERARRPSYILQRHGGGCRVVFSILNSSAARSGRIPLPPMSMRWISGLITCIRYWWLSPANSVLRLSRHHPPNDGFPQVCHKPPRIDHRTHTSYA